MHLNDSIGKEARIQFVCNHHEQASAMAAEAYARVSGLPGVVNVTTGPGGINALNGVFGAWTDSIPMLVVSGQVKRETCMRALGITGLRQLGDQEADIVAMVANITKYAVLVDDPLSIRYHLERAWHLAQGGRPGPCWLDIPVDVQGMSIDPATLRGYDPAEDESALNTIDGEQLTSDCREVLDRIRNAKRPAILAGTGVRAALAIAEFDELCHRLGVPVTTAWTHDLIASDDPLFCGRQGTIGDRAGNFTVQSADLLLILGSRLNIRQTSYNWQSFARQAFKIQVDVDAAEFHKPTVQPNLAIHCDLKRFLREMLRQCDTGHVRPETHAKWLGWCRERVQRYPVVQERQRNAGPPLNPYYFIEQLSTKLAEDDAVSYTHLILDAGCATGGLLTALREQGFTAVAGLDPSPGCAAACRDRGFEAYVGSVASAPAHMPKFDCVVFSHVLEHVYDIPAFFAAARGLLTPGGCLYLETPDATRYDDYLYAPFQEFNTEHINHFSARALENTARRFGFQPVLVEQKIIRTAADTCLLYTSRCV